MPNNTNRPSREEAEAAVRTLIQWAGDNPDREGLLETPRRVTKAYEQFFAGYDSQPDKILGKTFGEVHGYDDIVLLKDMRLESHCEHHMVPFTGVAHVAYLPNKRVVGISKIARLIDVYGKRLQTQETLTSQIAKTLNDVLKPKGVIVYINAEHQCMTTRGIHKVGTTTTTITSLGSFKDNDQLEQKFFRLIGQKN